MIGALALAAFVRLHALDLVEFKFDESTAVDLTRHLLHGAPPTVGLTSSTGARNPPLFIYLTAIPLALRDDPLAATAFVGLVAVVAVALTYAVLRPRFGALTAVAATAFFGTAPWAVLYGRKIWAQDLLPVSCVLLLWSLFIVLEKPRSRAVLLVPVFLCLAFQLHFSALALLLPAGIVLVYRARDVNWPACAVGIGVALLLLGPWLGHQVTHGFADVDRLLAVGRGDSGSSAIGTGTVEAVRQTTYLLGARNWDYVLGTSRSAFVAESGWAWSYGMWASIVGTTLLMLGLVTCAVRIARGAALRRGWPGVRLDTAAGRRALLLVWLLGVWLSYATTKGVLPHYLIVSYPVSFCVQALALSDIVAVARARLRLVVVAAAVVLTVAVPAGYVGFTVAFDNFLDRHGGTRGDYGVVYRDKDALARVLRHRGLRVAREPVLDFLVSGAMDAPRGAAPLVTVRNTLVDSKPLSCDGVLRTFGPLLACLPP